MLALEATSCPATAAAARASPARLMTTREVAALFARSPRTIRNWVRAGHLHPVRIGGAVFFRPEEVEALAGRRS